MLICLTRLGEAGLGWAGVTVGNGLCAGLFQVRKKAFAIDQISCGHDELTRT